MINYCRSLRPFFHEEESIEHLFFNCSRIHPLVSFLPNCSLPTWGLKKILKAKTLTQMNLFSIVLWTIWKTRNNKKFGNYPQSPTEIFLRENNRLIALCKK